MSADIRQRLSSNAELVRLYEDSSSELRRVLFRRLGNEHEADEVAQDAFLKIHQFATRDEIEDLRKFLFTMATHMALNIIRRRGVEQDYLSFVRTQVLGDEDARSLGPDREFSGKLDLQKVMAALKELPVRTRQVFLMHRFQGASYVEIATQLQLSTKAVEYHMNRALVAVMSLFGEED